MSYGSKAKNLIDVFDADLLLLKEILEDLKSVKEVYEIRIKQMEKIIAAHDAIEKDSMPDIPLEFRTNKH